MRWPGGCACLRSQCLSGRPLLPAARAPGAVVGWPPRRELPCRRPHPDALTTPAQTPLPHQPITPRPRCAPSPKVDPTPARPPRPKTSRDRIVRPRGHGEALPGSEHHQHDTGQRKATLLQKLQAGLDSAVCQPVRHCDAGWTPSGAATLRHIDALEPHQVDPPLNSWMSARPALR
jgi:hypothetical protein